MRHLEKGPKIQYSSVPTRGFSFDQFLGDGIINDTVQPMTQLPIDNSVDLRSKFGSNLPTRMLPKAFGLKFDRIPIMGRNWENEE